MTPATKAARSLTVLQMLPALDGGGVEQGTVEISNALSAAGHRSLVMSAGGRLEQALTATECLHWPIGKKSPLTLRYVAPLRRLLRTENVDILHARSRFPAWVAYLAWSGMPRESRPRFVTTAHGFYSVSRYSSVMARGERVIAVSDSIRRYLLAAYPQLDPERIELIFRGVDETRYSPSFSPSAQWREEWREEWRQRWPEFVASPAPRLLTLAGRITRLKGHHDFIALIGQLRARGLDVHGLVAGAEDPRHRRYASEVRTRARDSGLERYVHWLGHRADLRELFAVSDVVLSLSTQPESFGRTVLEALALGRPVAAYAHGGVGEVLDAMCPAGAILPHDLSHAVETVIGLLAKPPAIRAAPQFSVQRMLDQTLALYERLAAGRS